MIEEHKASIHGYSDTEEEEFFEDQLPQLRDFENPHDGEET